MSLGPDTFTDLDFEDDAILLADTWLILVGMIRRMEEETQNFDINISNKKSEVMVISREIRRTSTQNI